MDETTPKLNPLTTSDLEAMLEAPSRGDLGTPPPPDIAFDTELLMHHPKVDLMPAPELVPTHKPAFWGAILLSLLVLSWVVWQGITTVLFPESDQIVTSSTQIGDAELDKIVAVLYGPAAVAQVQTATYDPVAVVPPKPAQPRPVAYPKVAYRVPYARYYPPQYYGYSPYAWHPQQP